MQLRLSGDKYCIKSKWISIGLQLQLYYPYLFNIAESLFRKSYLIVHFYRVTGLKIRKSCTTICTGLVAQDLMNLCCIKEILLMRFFKRKISFALYIFCNLVNMIQRSYCMSVTKRGVTNYTLFLWIEIQIGCNFKIESTK